MIVETANGMRRNGGLITGSGEDTRDMLISMDGLTK